MIAFKEFYAAAKLVDPDVLVSFGRKWVYLTPTGKFTSDKYEPYCSVMRAYGQEARPGSKRYGFQVWAPRSFLHGAPAWCHGMRLEGAVRKTLLVIAWVREWDTLNYRVNLKHNATNKMMTRFLHVDDQLRQWGVVP